MRTLLCLPLAFGAILLWAVCGAAKDVKVNSGDDDTIIACSVGDTICVSWLANADRIDNDRTELVAGHPYYRAGRFPGTRGVYRFDVKTAGAADLVLRKEVLASKNIKVTFHIQASEAKK